MADMDTCGNCGHHIPEPDDAHFWKDHVVCTACKEKLTRAAKAKSSKSKVGAAPKTAGASATAATTTRTKPASAAAAQVDSFPDADEVDVRPPAHRPRSKSQRPAVRPTTYECTECGVTCGADQIANVDGQLLCTSCAGFAAPGASSEDGQGAGSPRAKSPLPPWMPLAIAGTVLGIVIVVSAMLMVHSGSGEDETPAPTPPTARRPVAQPASATTPPPAPAEAT